MHKQHFQGRDEKLRTQVQLQIRLQGITDKSQLSGDIVRKYIADGCDRDHVYRGSLDAEGNTKQDALKWDAVVAMFGKAHDPTQKRAKVERTTLWSGDMIVRKDNVGHTGQLRAHAEYALAEQADTGKYATKNSEPRMPKAWKSEKAQLSRITKNKYRLFVFKYAKF